MHDKVTKKDIERMRQEIEYRKLVVRKEALEAVKEARSHGDLSENFRTIRTCPLIQLGGCELECVRVLQNCRSNPSIRVHRPVCCDGSGKDQAKATLGPLNKILNGLVFKTTARKMVLATANGRHAKPILHGESADLERRS